MPLHKSQCLLALLLQILNHAESPPVSLGQPHPQRIRYPTVIKHLDCDGVVQG